MSVIIPAVGAVIRNIGHSDSKGFEIAVGGQPMANLFLHANYGYTYARFLAANTGKKSNYTGNMLPMVPRHTLSVNANYSMYLSLIHISEPTRLHKVSRMPSSA